MRLLAGYRDGHPGAVAGDLVFSAVGGLSTRILCRPHAVGRYSQVGRAGTEHRRGRAPDPALEVAGAPDAPYLYA